MGALRPEPAREEAAQADGTMPASSGGEGLPARHDPIDVVVSRTVAKDHAICLAVVARERAALRAALERGITGIDELAEDLNVTARAIRHLLGLGPDQ